ncbi:MAG: TraB/GumN family protein [Candidatus Krumholzibacteria bacterium]|nr:TraB/GumN family protein [Candidatus Krumholzibacteria bacterium]
MKKTFSSFFVIVMVFYLFTVGYSTASAEGLVWKVSKGKSVVYLGGTIHMLRASDYPLPEEYDKAYEDSEILVFETDMDELQSPDIQMRIMAEAMLPEGQGLDDLLSVSTYEALSTYCDSAGMPLAMLNQLRPSIVVISLMSLELQKQGIGQEGVDIHYHGRAVADGRGLAALESIDEQLGYLLSMGDGYEDEFVLHSIEDMKEVGQQIEKLIEAWREGDDEAMAELMIDDVKEKFPDIYRDLFKGRNDKWLPEIEKLFATPEKEFVLVGSAHLVGDDGIIEALRDKGYKIKKVR